MTKIKPDYRRATLLAGILIRRLGINQFPINPLEVIDKIEVVELMTFKTIAEITNTDVESVKKVMIRSQDGCISYSEKKQKYLIAYNDDLNETTVERIRFTLAHELGHYILKHVHQTKASKLAIDGISDHKYDIFEKEANCFATELIAPTDLVKKLINKNVTTISEVFGLSIQASEFRIKNLDWVQQYHSISLENILYSPRDKNMQKSIQLSLYVKKHYFCPQCGNMQHTHHEINYCNICNCTDLESVSLDDYYRFYEFNNNKIVTYRQLDYDNVCPKCSCRPSNPRTTECFLCGTPLKNSCSNIREQSQASNGGATTSTVRCNEPLTPESRYCSKCGCMSIFYKNILLLPWFIEKSDFQKKQLVKNPFKQN